MPPTQWTRAGDVIQLRGPTVPLEVQQKYFRIESIDDGIVRLSQPFDDAHLTRETPVPTRDEDIPLPFGESPF